MRIDIILTAHRLKAPFSHVLDEYLKRLPKQWHVQFKWLAPQTALSPPQKQQREWIEQQACIQSGAQTILLSPKGKTLSTPAWCQQLEKHTHWQFFIGGSDGFCKEAYQQIPTQYALSPLTFPHGLALIVLVEQLYRFHCYQIQHPYCR